MRVLGSGVHGRATLVRYQGRLACLKEGLRGPSQNLSFWREAGTLRRVNGAGGAPRIYKIGADWPMLLTDFIPYPSIKTFIQNDQIKSHTQIIDIYHAAAAALAEVHRAGFVHCDIKSDNLLVDACPGTSRVFFIDFGMAWPVGETPPYFKKHQPGDHSCHPHYAPEFYYGGPATTTSDVYSLGVMMTNLLTLDRYSDIEVVAPGISDLCRKMTSPDPHLRPSLTVVVNTL